MALELAKLINCDVANSDQENLDRLLEEYMCGGSDESGSESDTDECNGRSSDEDDLFDERLRRCHVSGGRIRRHRVGFGGRRTGES